MMATSSIFTQITITDRQQAERFIDALAKSAKAAEKHPRKRKYICLTDPEQIKALMAKRRKRRG